MCDLFVFYCSHPDVMTVEYDVKPWSALFFDIFLLIGLYLLLNLVSGEYGTAIAICLPATYMLSGIVLCVQFLAVVYSTFGDHEKNKFMKLYLHKRFLSC